MNKELTKLLRADDGVLKVGDGIVLHRWTKNALGDEVDGLCLVVTLPSGRVVSRPIASRLPSGVAVEMSEAARLILIDYAQATATALRNGYWR